MTLTIYRELLQGTPEWFAVRRGMLTASTIGALITTKPPSALDYACPQCSASAGDSCVSVAKGAAGSKPIKSIHSPRSTKAVENPDDLPDRLAVSEGETARTLVAALVAERVTEWEDPEFTNGDMMRGHQVEPIARDWYSLHTGHDVEQVGFMALEFDDGTKLGYSPDGLVGDDGLLEIKAPRAKRHILAHLDGGVPAEHVAQVQTGMYVSGRSWCDFISYVGGEPPFLTRVEADPDWFEAIEAATKAFEVQAAEMAEAYRAAIAGLEKTAVLPDPYDVELRLA